MRESFEEVSMVAPRARVVVKVPSWVEVLEEVKVKVLRSVGES
jgi:hypothetical protein